MLAPVGPSFIRQPPIRSGDNSDKAQHSTTLLQRPRVTGFEGEDEDENEAPSEHLQPRCVGRNSRQGAVLQYSITPRRRNEHEDEQEQENEAPGERDYSLRIGTATPELLMQSAQKFACLQRFSQADGPEIRETFCRKACASAAVMKITGGCRMHSERRSNSSIPDIPGR